jgi:aminoglycoside phosphotransferase (APT) family kinase protein
MKLMPIAADTPVLCRYATPVLHHANLHMGNIFVAEDDATAIVSVIDWQFVSVMPRFMQARWPAFI